MLFIYFFKMPKSVFLSFRIWKGLICQFTSGQQLQKLQYVGSNVTIKTFMWKSRTVLEISSFLLFNKKEVSKNNFWLTFKKMIT